MESSTTEKPAVALPLSNGRIAIIDAEDYPRASQYTWSQSGNYVRGWVNGERVYLHRFVMGLKRGDGLEIDHCNRDPLDCRNCNLRVVSRKTNIYNRHLRARTESGVIGVCREGATGKWLAYAGRDGRRHNLGRFDVLEDAVAARQRFDEERPLKPDMSGCRCTEPSTFVSHPDSHQEN